MERYKVEVVEKVWQKDLPKIDKSMGDDIVRITMQKLSTAPLKYGAPLRHELQGLRKLKVSKYRVIYEVKGDKVIILAIGIRDKVYG